MTGHVLAALIGNYMTTCFVLGLVVAAVAIARHPGPRPGGTVSGIVLNNLIFYGIGCGQAVNFVMHSLLGDLAARTIGWAQSPFQLELAFSSLGVAVIAFVVHGTCGQLRAKVAVVVATAIFNYGAAAGHIYQMVVNRDFAVNNTGLLLVTDIAIPTVGLAVVLWHALTRGDATSTDARTTAKRARPVTNPVAA